MNRLTASLLAAALMALCAGLLWLRWGQLAVRDPDSVEPLELAPVLAAHAEETESPIAASLGSALADAAAGARGDDTGADSAQAEADGAHDGQDVGGDGPPAASSRYRAPEDAPHTYATAGEPEDTSAQHRTGNAGGQSAPGGSAGAQSGSAGRVNINTASAQQLATLPGIGEVLAARIVAYRKAHGPFKSVDGLLAVDGIGEGKLAKLKPCATVGK